MSVVAHVLGIHQGKVYIDNPHAAKLEAVDVTAQDPIDTPVDAKQKLVPEADGLCQVRSSPHNPRSTALKVNNLVLGNGLPVSEVGHDAEIPEPERRESVELLAVVLGGSVEGVGEVGGLLRGNLGGGGKRGGDDVGAVSDSKEVGKGLLIAGLRVAGPDAEVRVNIDCPPELLDGPLLVGGRILELLQSVSDEGILGKTGTPDGHTHGDPALLLGVDSTVLDLEDSLAGGNLDTAAGEDGFGVGCKVLVEGSKDTGSNVVDGNPDVLLEAGVGLAEVLKNAVVELSAELNSGSFSSQYFSTYPEMKYSRPPPTIAKFKSSLFLSSLAVGREASSKHSNNRLRIALASKTSFKK